jgi:hypothetical protein
MYGKLFVSMFDGTLGTRGPWQALVTFQQLVILADRQGIVDMTADAISRRTTIPLDIIQQGLSELEKPDPYSRSPAEEGARIIRLDDHRPWGWQIVNYAHYRELRTADDRREYMRQYQRKRRADVNNVNNVNRDQPGKTDVDVEVDVKAVKPSVRATRLPPDFELSKEATAFAKEKQPTWSDEHLKTVFENFRDYWVSSPKGTKLDWSATWRTWVRKEAPMASSNGKGMEWFRSGEGIMRKGRELGISPKPGESQADYASRIREKA